MPNTALSEARVKALAPRKSAYDIRDAKLQGFGVRVLPSGTKRFFIHTQHRGKRTWRIVGDANSITIDEGRTRADSMLASIRRPTDSQASPEDTRFEAVAEAVFHRHARVWKPGTLAVKERFPRAVAEGVLQRVREGRELPPQSEDLLSGGSFSLEDEALLKAALSMDSRDDRADAAASVLGPHSVGRLVDIFLALHRELRNARAYDKELGDRLRVIQDRIACVPVASLLTAISDRSPDADHQTLVAMANLIARHPDGKDGRGQPFDAATRDTIAEFSADWGERLLSSQAATRGDLESVATLASRSGAARLLPILKRLLDEELSRWRGFREQAHAEGYRQGMALTEMRRSRTLQYQRAFLAMDSPDTAALMREYLLDEDFGRSAAVVIAGQWTDVNEPILEDMWRPSPDYSRVAEKREQRLSAPGLSSEAADDIFGAVEDLIESGMTEDQAGHAVGLAIVAAALPHGTGLDTTSMGRNEGSGSGTTDGRNSGSRRHLNTRFVFRSYRRATCETDTSRISVCATIRRFSSRDHRRRIRLRPGIRDPPSVHLLLVDTYSHLPTFKPATAGDLLAGRDRRTLTRRAGVRWQDLGEGRARVRARGAERVGRRDALHEALLGGRRRADRPDRGTLEPRPRGRPRAQGHAPARQRRGARHERSRVPDGRPIASPHDEKGASVLTPTRTNVSQRNTSSGGNPGTGR